MFSNSAQTFPVDYQIELGNASHGVVNINNPNMPTPVQTAESNLPTSAQTAESNSAGKAREQVVFAEKGDVILQTGSVNFLVSSHVLEIASSVFKSMFKPNFREGSSNRSQSDPIIIPLPEDDNGALDLLLRGLHHKLRRNVEFPNVDQLFTLTRLCDKYDVIDAMEANLLRWFQACLKMIPVTISSPNTESLLSLSSVAYIMGSRTEFRKVTKLLLRSITQVNCPDVEQYDLPCELEVYLHLHREQLLNAMMSNAHEILVSLSKPGPEYVLESHKICDGCGREKPLATKRCPRCKRDEFTQPTCDSNYRLSCFVQRLSANKLFPFSKGTEWTALIVQREVGVFCSKGHHCSGNRDCPFVKALERLRSQVTETLENFGGLDLGFFKSLNA